MERRFRSLVLAFFLFSILPAAAQQRYTLTDIGNLGGYYGGSAWAINARGEVVGASDVTHDIEKDTDHAFYWSESTGIIDLGVLVDQSGAAGINRSGTVVGWSYRNNYDSVADGIRWTKNSGMQSLTGPTTYVVGASGINDSAQVVGTFYAVYKTNAEHAYRLTGFVLEDLGTLGGKNSYAYAINATGQVVGFSNTPTSGALDGRAVLWQEGSGMKDLGTLPGDSFSAAAAINKSGQIAGGSYTSFTGPYRAFLWTENDAMRQIGTRPDFPGDSSYSALGMNDLGQVVGYANQHAFIWSKAHGMHDLNKLIPPTPDGSSGKRGPSITPARSWAKDTSGATRTLTLSC